MSFEIAGLHEIVSKILLIDSEDINESLTQNDVEEWDSMAHLVLISEIEETYGISIEDDEIVEILSIGDLVQTLKKHNINFNSK